MEHPWMAQAKGNEDIVRPIARRGAFSVKSYDYLEGEDEYEGNGVMEDDFDKWGHLE